MCTCIWTEQVSVFLSFNPNLIVNVYLMVFKTYYFTCCVSDTANKTKYFLKGITDLKLNTGFPLTLVKFKTWQSNSIYRSLKVIFFIYLSIS